MRTKPFRMTRIELASVGALEYARQFWWVFAAIPISGIVALALAPNNLFRYFGTVCILWPVTIPARAAIISSRLAKLFSVETIAEVSEGQLRFARKDGKGGKIDLTAIRNTAIVANALVARTKSLGFVAIPDRAFESTEQRDAFRRALSILPEE